MRSDWPWCRTPSTRFRCVGSQARYAAMTRPWNIHCISSRVMQGTRMLIVLAWIALPAIALAKPKLAIAPLDGDSDGKMANVIVEEAAKHAKVVGPKEVGDTMESLGMTDTASKRALKKLRARLEVDAVLYGTLEKD